MLCSLHPELFLFAQHTKCTHLVIPGGGNPRRCYSFFLSLQFTGACSVLCFYRHHPKPVKKNFTLICQVWKKHFSHWKSYNQIFCCCHIWALFVSHCLARSLPPALREELVFVHLQRRTHIQAALFSQAPIPFSSWNSVSMPVFKGVTICWYPSSGKTSIRFAPQTLKDKSPVSPAERLCFFYMTVKNSPCIHHTCLSHVTWP